MKLLTLGSDPNNTLVLSDVSVSGVHCRLSLTERNTLLVQDLDTRFGTFVNGRPVLQKEITPNDSLSLGCIPLETSLLFKLFSYQKPPNGVSWEKFRQQEAAIEAFPALEKVYLDFMDDKKRLLKNNLIKSTGIRAGLSLIPIIGAPLSILSSALTSDVQEKLMAREEKFKTDYVCPRCFRFLAEPFENLRKRGYCVGCHTPFVR